MKQTIIILLTTLFSSSISAQEFYNLDAYQEKQTAKPAKFGAYAQINGELSVMALPSVTGQDCTSLQV